MEKIINEIKDVFNLQLAVEEAEERNIEFKIVVKTKDNIIPSINWHRKNIIEKIIIEAVGESTKKTIIYGELLKDKVAKEDIKKLLENNKFHTFGGTYDVAALLTEDIYLNIYRDWCTIYKKPLRNLLDTEDVEIAMNNVDFNPVKEELAFERGKAFYFGLGIDENMLSKHMNNCTVKMNEHREKILSILGKYMYTEIKNDSEMGHVVEKIIHNGHKLRVLERVMNNTEVYENIRDLAYNTFWFKRYKNELSVLKSIEKNLIDGTIKLANYNYSCHRQLFGHALNDGIIAKPREGYSLVEITSPNQLQFKLMHLLSDNEEEIADYYIYMASKTLDKRLEDTTLEDKKLFKKYFFIYMANNFIEDKVEYIKSNFSDYTEEEFYENKHKIFNYLDNMGNTIKQDISKLPLELRDTIKTLDSTANIINPRVINKIDESITNSIILKIQEHFGRDNFRIRYIGKIFGRTIYEVGNGEVEELLKYIDDSKIEIGNGILKLNTNKILK